jgi:hypothetical protein
MHHTKIRRARKETCLRTGSNRWNRPCTCARLRPAMEPGTITHPYHTRVVTRPLGSSSSNFSSIGATGFVQAFQRTRGVRHRPLHEREHETTSTASIRAQTITSHQTHNQSNIITLIIILILIQNELKIHIRNNNNQPQITSALTK